MKKIGVKAIQIYIITTIILFMLLIVKVRIIGIESKVRTENTNINSYEVNSRKVYEIIETSKIENTIIYLHGGAYVEGIKENQIVFLEKLSKQSNSRIILLDYPLAPKYTYIDVYAMIEAVYNNEIEKEKNIILMGDSAGGGIALGLVNKLQLENRTLPQKTILLSPWLDVTMKNTEIEKVIPYDKKLNKEVLKLAGISYAGTDGMNSYLVNPILGNYEKINNIYILSGTSDILNPDSKKLVEKNKNIKYIEYPEAQHIFMIENNNEDTQKEQAFQDILDIIN